MCTNGAATLVRRASGFPSPLWGGVRGGGNPHLRCSGNPPTLSLPHKGGGDAVAAAMPHTSVAFVADEADVAHAHLPASTTAEAPGVSSQSTLAILRTITNSSRLVPMVP